MMINPELKDLPTADLNQRYAETWVQYDGKIVWVEGFERVSSGPVVSLDAGPYQPFEWEKLNVERPSPRFVKVRSAIYWCWYLPRRQWHRGFSLERNCEAFMMTPAAERHKFPEILAEWHKEPTPSYSLDVRDHHLMRSHHILTPLMGYVGGSFYCRLKEIARYEGDNTIVVTVPAFEQEIREHTIGADIHARA